MTYKCRDCGEEFDIPAEVAEDLGLGYGTVETWYYCPHCGSDDFDYTRIVEAEEVDDECDS